MLLLLLACVDTKLAPLQPADVAGRVVLDDGTPVVGADVTVAGVALVTDEEGEFTLTGLAPAEVLVTATAASTTSAHLNAALEGGETTELVLPVMALAEATLADAGAGGTVTTPEGLTIELPEGALVDESVTLASGPATVRYALLNTSTSLITAPGGLRARGVDGDLVPLATDGMVDVRIEQDGAPLQLVRPATLSFPAIGNAPVHGDFRAYWFDEEDGAWLPDGDGEVVDGRFVVTVEHFSYWNADVPTRGDGCLTFALTLDGEPLANRSVGVWLSDGTSTVTVTDRLGGLYVQATSGYTLTVGIVWDEAGNVGAEAADAIWSLGPVTVPAAPECADLGGGEPTGVDQDGDGVAVQPWGNECDDHDPTTTEPCADSVPCDTGADDTSPCR